MFSLGSNGLRTPRRRAVAGMSCMRPRAPFRDTAVGTPFDSARMTAAMKDGSTPCSFAAARICEEYGEEREGRGVSEGVRRERLAPASLPAAVRSPSPALTTGGRSYSSSTMRSTTSIETVIEPPPGNVIETRSSSPPAACPRRTSHFSTRRSRPSSKTTSAAAAGAAARKDPHVTNSASRDMRGRKKIFLEGEWTASRPGRVEARAGAPPSLTLLRKSSLSLSLCPCLSLSLPLPRSSSIATIATPSGASGRRPCARASGRRGCRSRSSRCRRARA